MLSMNVSLVMIYCTMIINYGVVDRTQSADMMLSSVLLEEQDYTRSRLRDSDKLHSLRDYTLYAVLMHPWTVKVLCFVGFSANLSWLSLASMVNFLVAAGASGWHQAYTVLGPSGTNG